jgi:two-component system, cell cycle sensor histidine kinase and response regulator CckA
MLRHRLFLVVCLALVCLLACLYIFSRTDEALPSLRALEFFLVAGLTFGAAILILLGKMAVARVTSLSASVVAIGTQGDLSVRVCQSGADELSKLGGAINSMLDALQRSQQEQSDRTARLQLLVNQIPAVLWTTDTSLRFTSSLGAALTSINLRPDQVVGLTLFDFFQTKDPDFPPIAAHRRALNGESVTFEQNWGERTFDTHVEPLRNPDGTIYGSVGIALDITEHKNTEKSLRQSQEALQKSEQRFRALVQFSSDIITVLEADGTVRYESPSLERLFGYCPEEIIGKNAFEFVHPDDVGRVLQIFQERLPIPGNIPPIEFRFRHKDGSWRVLEAMGNNLLQDSQVGGVVVNSRDITERRQLEEQLRQAQKMEAIGHLAGGMAHDFNNLLTIISGRNEIQLSHLDIHSPLRLNALQIKEAADRAAALIGQLLAFSRKQVVRPALLDLNTIVQEMGKMLPPLLGEQIQLLVTPGANPCLVKADSVQIQQIVMNLAVNARDAMPNGGHLKIEASLAKREDVSGHPGIGIPAGTYAALAVSDNGAGMDPETQRRIFEPFFTTKEPGRGTGLGLSTVYGIVKQSGGHIAVDSRLGHGTTFKIYWPAMEGSIPELETSKPPAAAHASGSETILLVEDEHGIREMIRDFLSGKGYEMLEAENGLQALQICEACEKPIHLVLTDMIMPNMTGRELADRITTILPQTCILYMSGYTDENIAEDGPAAQSILLISKPFTLEALDRKVREALELRHGSSSSPSPAPELSPKSSAATAGN